MSDKETARRDAAILFIKRHNAVCAASDDIPEGAWQLFVKFAAECTAPAPQPDWKKEALALVVLLRAKCSEEEWASTESRFAAATPQVTPTDTENLCYCGNPMNWSASSGCYYPHVGCKRKFEGTSEQASTTPDKCPTCGSPSRERRNCKYPIPAHDGDSGYHRYDMTCCTECDDSWHSSASTPKGTK